MKKQKIQVVGAGIALCMLIAGCQGKEHTISWWKDQDANKRDSFVAQCRDDRAKEMTPDCQNAISAKTDLKMSGSSQSKSASPDPLH